MLHRQTSNYILLYVLTVVYWSYYFMMTSRVITSITHHSDGTRAHSEVKHK